MDNAPYTIGDLDKNAIEEGVRIKERQGGKVILLSAGDSILEETVKEGLAMGADESVLVVDDRLRGAESWVVAEILAKAIEQIGENDLIILGEGSSDNYSGQVGPRLAELLALPQVTFVSKLDIEGNKLRAVRNMGKRFEVVEAELPAIVTVMSDINKARIPAVTQILKAGRKPKKVLTPEKVGVNIDNISSKVEILSNLAPLQERKQIIFDENLDIAVAKLVDALKGEGLVGR